MAFVDVYIKFIIIILEETLASEECMQAQATIRSIPSNLFFLNVTSDAHLRPVREYVTLLADCLCAVHIPQSKYPAKVANPPHPCLPEPLDRPVPVFGSLNTKREVERMSAPIGAIFSRFPQ
jgi:hypothetical protein